MNELSGLGLKPAILHELIEASEGVVPAAGTSHIEEATLDIPSQPISELDELSLKAPKDLPVESVAETRFSPIPRVVYELNSNSGRIEPKLRIWISMPAPEVEFPKDVGMHLSRALRALELDEDGADSEVESLGDKGLLWSLQQKGVQMGDRDE